MNIKHYIGLAILIGISISFVILSSTLGYKIYLGINAEDVALAVKIIFFTTFILLLLLIGAITGWGFYYFAMKSTISTIAKNIDANGKAQEKTQEIASELAKKALETTITISKSNYFHPPVVNNLNLSNKEEIGEEKEDEKVIKLHQWEKG